MEPAQANTPDIHQGPLRTTAGAEKVVSIDIWRNLVTLQDENRQRRVHITLELGVASAIHLSHTALAERPEDLVRTEEVSG